MKKVTINLYDFSELNEEAKERAIQEYREFFLEVTQPSDFDYDEDYEASMKEIETDDDYIIDEIKANEYLYFSDGELASCTTYTGKHPKAGTTELKIGNDVYTL